MHECFSFSQQKGKVDVEDNKVKNGQLGSGRSIPVKQVGSRG